MYYNYKEYVKPKQKNQNLNNENNIFNNFNIFPNNIYIENNNQNIILFPVYYPFQNNIITNNFIHNNFQFINDFRKRSYTRNNNISGNISFYDGLISKSQNSINKKKFQKLKSKNVYNKYIESKKISIERYQKHGNKLDINIEKYEIEEFKNYLNSLLIPIPDYLCSQKGIKEIQKYINKSPNECKTILINSINNCLPKVII